jgi:PERQ amino acid-rich with GYF domain-containing protein
MHHAWQERIRTNRNLQDQANAKHENRSRRPNGTTQTFRRPSNQVSSGSNTFQSRESTSTSQNRNSSENVGVYIPPHRNGASSEGMRYSKDQLLELFRREHDVGHLKDGISDLYMNGWEPSFANGMSNTSWGRRDDQKEGQTGADISWDKDGHVHPLALSSLTEEEKEVRSFLLYENLLHTN